MREIFRDAGVRAYLLVWGGQVVSLLGSGLTAFALGVWIYQQTASTTQYALVTFCAAVPPLLVLPLAGPLIDRTDRKRLLIACEVIAAAATLTVGALAWLGALTLAWACVIAAVTSASGAIQGPTHAATVTLLVPRQHLGRASGLVHLAMATSQIVAPPLAGLLLPLIGLYGITALDAATFIVAMATIFTARIPRGVREETETRSYARDLKFGWAYIFARPGLAALLVTFAMINFFSEVAAILFTPLVLTFSTPAALGSILASGGIGMVLGGAFMSAWGGPTRRALGAVLFAAVSGVTVAAAGFVRGELLLGAVVFAFFFFEPLTMGCGQVLWQRSVPAALQGRVFAARATVAMSAIPLASLVVGPLADRILEPAMARGGALAPVFGPFLGVGRGRGIALAIVGSGIASAVIAGVAASYGPLRRLGEAEPSPAPAPAPEPARAGG